MKATAIKDYVFTDDLHNTPLMLTTFFYNKSYITMLENLPTTTFRGDAHKQDVIGVNKTWREAKQFHEARLKETKKVQRGDK